MKYKIGDKTVLGRVVATQTKYPTFIPEDDYQPYDVYTISGTIGNLYLSESEIDKIIIKPKRNIDVIMEMWDDTRHDDAVELFGHCLRHDTTYEDIVELAQPYIERSRYPKLTPEELKAVKWLVEGGFEGLERGCFGSVIAVDKYGIRCVMNEMPVCIVLVDSTWLPKEFEPINLTELLAAQDGMKKRSYRRRIAEAFGACSD